MVCEEEERQERCGGQDMRCVGAVKGRGAGQQGVWEVEEEEGCGR